MRFAYFDEIVRILDIVERQESEKIEQAAGIIADAIKNKRAIFAFGASHAGILTQELYYRAGGLMVINPIFGRELMLDTQPVTLTSAMERLPGYGRSLAGKVPFSAGDVLIAHSVSGRNPVTVELALAAKEKGVKVIALTSLAYSQEVASRSSGGQRLFEVADLVLDNHGETGDACIAVHGVSQKVAPTSTVIGAAILNTMVAEITRRLAEDGVETPPVFHSVNLDGGEEKNRTIVESYRDVIHYSY